MNETILNNNSITILFCSYFMFTLVGSGNGTVTIKYSKFESVYEIN